MFCDIFLWDFLDSNQHHWRTPSDRSDQANWAMDATKFDQLPDLCLRKIFSFLRLRDLAKFRTMNRRLKFHADRASVTDLVVREVKGFAGQSRNWFRTDRQIDLENSISLTAFKTAKSALFNHQPLDKQLKFLYISLLNENVLGFEILNSLTQLVHLEVFAFTRLGWTTLDLPNLKVLAIYSHPRVVLKTPKLEVLQCDAINRIRFEYPETIKRVGWNNIGGGAGDLSKFVNLEVRMKRTRLRWAERSASGPPVRNSSVRLRSSDHRIWIVETSLL